MPVTGNLGQENNAPEEYEGQNCSVDTDHIAEGSSQTLDNNSAEVSSTTVDSDTTAETSLSGPAFFMDISEPVQSSSDSLKDFKDQTVSIDESVSKPSSSTESGLTNPNKGFQDAFAAFASANCRGLEEERPMDVVNVSNFTAEPVGSSVVESLVSSAIDSAQVTTTSESFAGYEADAHQIMLSTEPDSDSQSVLGTEHSQDTKLAGQTQLEDTNQTEAVSASDSVYFIQTTDASGQVVTSIIDPNDIPSYSDSVVYKQCMKADGEIETTIVNSGCVGVSQEEQPQEQAVNSEETDIQQGEQQIIYAHDLSGQLTPIDPIQSANDVAPPGKQFVYMQDSTGRIIRTVMDANQTMVPGQQVYYTQSEDGQMITSVMDSALPVGSEDSTQEQQLVHSGDQVYQQQMSEVDIAQQQQQEASTGVIDSRTTGFNIDNSMSGLSMLAELSHLTAGQAANAPGLATEQRTTSSTDSSNSMDMDEFRPVAMVTRRLASEEGVESISSDVAELKVGETDSDSFDQGSLLQGDNTGHEESLITKFVSQMKGELAQPSYTVSRDNLFVQWQNLDAMCWMDVVLIMLVYSPTLRPLVNLDPSHELASTLLITLVKANRQAQVLLQNLLKKSNGAMISDVQTGAGNIASIQDPKTSKLVCKENMDEIGKAINILYAMREKIWQALQPRLRCERGKHNSPVLVLPLLVREKPAIKQMFTMSYRYVFKCEKCSYSQDDRHTKILPSIPAVPEDFNMKEPYFVRNCFECQAPNQRMLMKFEQLEDFVQMHFVKGLPHSRFEELSFDFNDDHYEVTTVVHYKNNPDHFIAWVRNAPGTAWMECDDLKSVITRYLNVPPNIPPSQVHMVMWERRLTQQHTLVMRDTEDTKLLASLVLTVQQPVSHQAIESDTRQAGLPGTTTSSATAPVSSTNLLSGLMAQTFAPYTPRGRGRGRGSRGSYGGRGRAAATTTPIIRRVTPAVTQVSSPSVISIPQSHTSPQTISLPLSALASSGLQLRGSAPGGARFVLVGNGSQGGTAVSGALARSGTPSKVVVVRSQGGAANISAAQLLQLLQRTGAISQVGTRITTTVTTAGANTASAASTSYIVQQDGNITATTLSKDASLSYVTTQQNAEGTMETESVYDNPNKQSSNEQISSAVANQTVSHLPYSRTSATTSEQAPYRDSFIQSSEPDVHTSSNTLSEPASVNEEVAREQTNLRRQSVTISQQSGGRYIQVPNPAGGGTLLCQLGMRDGKMVLVPVDKNAQTKVTGSSILKLSTTPASSSKISICAGGTTQQTISSSSAGAVIAQIQKQLLQTHSTSSGTSTGPRFITFPSGNKRIQLITVPHGQADQSNTGSIISPVSNQQLDAGTSSVETVSVDGHMVNRESKISEGNNVTMLPTSLCTSVMERSAVHLVSTPAVSLLKDVSARLATSRTSLLISEQQKPTENFRYVLPGSNTTHILHTGPSGVEGGLGQTGRIFTALSSSGTIVGGQLTPSPSSTVGTSPMDQDLAFGDTDDSSQSASVLALKQRLNKDFDTTEYIPLGTNRGRARGVQRGGRGRGGRGRGRSQLWTADAELMAPAPVASRKISTLADLRQIGAHVIESGSEAIDGIPVVSIPDFSTEGSSQTEIISAAQSIISEIGSGSIRQGISSFSDAHSELAPQDIGSVSAAQEPRVITQPIPSIKINHGFDILTQGIMGSGKTSRLPLSSLKQARSLLTGTTTTLQSASSLLASLSETTASTLASTVSSIQTVGQAEIDTLIQAAQAAAKPTNARSQTSLADVIPEDTSSSVCTSSLLKSSDFSLDQTNDTSVNVQEVDVANESSNTDELMSTQLLHSEKEHDGTIISIDENQVSAAERYRMPVELFQPDEESPEKSMKLDDHTNRVAASLSPRLFHGDEITRFSQKQNKDAVQNHPTKEPLKEKPRSPKSNEYSTQVIEPSTWEHPAVQHLPDSAEGAADIMENMESGDGSDTNALLGMKDEAEHDRKMTPKNVGRPRGRPKGRASTLKGRRQSHSTITHEHVETVGSVPFDDTTAIETVPVVTSSSSPERFPDMSSPEKESLQPSAIVDSLMESNEIKPEFKDNDFQGSKHIETGYESSVAPKKFGRSRKKPKGGTSNKGGRKKLNSSTEIHEESVGTVTSDATSTIGAVVAASRFLPERFPDLSSPDKESLLHSAIVEGPVTDSLMESDNVVADKPNEMLKSTSITEAVVQGSQHVQLELDMNLTTKVGRPKRQAKGSASKSWIRRKSHNTSVPEHVETVSTSSAIGALERFPEKETFEPSDNAGGFVTDSLMDKGNETKCEEEFKDDDLPKHIQVGHDTSFTPKKVGRRNGKSKSSTSKRVDKRKSNSTSELEHVEAVGRFQSEATTVIETVPVIISGSSPKIKYPQMSSSGTEQLERSSTAGTPEHTVSKSASNGDFQADSLLKSDTGVTPEEFKGDDPIDAFQDSQHVEMAHDIIFTPNKARKSRDRRKDIASKQRGRRKSGGTFTHDHVEIVSSLLFDDTSTNGTVPEATSKLLPKRFSEISSLEKESLLHSTIVEGPVTDSLMESDNVVADKPNEMLKSTSITEAVVQGSQHVQLELDMNLTTKVGRPKRQAKGSASKSWSRRKSHNTSAPEHVETVSTSSAIGALERFPEKETFEPSDNAGGFVTDSLMDKGNETKCEEEFKDDDLPKHIQVGHDTSFTPKKVGRRNGKSKSSTSKRVDKRKSNSTSELEHVETVGRFQSEATTVIETVPVIISGSSPKIKYPQMSSSGTEQLERSSTAGTPEHTVSKSASNGDFQADSLLKSDTGVTPEEFKGDDPIDAFQDSQHVEMEHDKSSKKVYRYKGRSKVSISNRGGKRKSLGSSVLDLLETTSSSQSKTTSVIATKSLPDRKFTQISSTNREPLQHSSNTSPVEHSLSKSSSNVFLTDSLMKSIEVKSEQESQGGDLIDVFQGSHEKTDTSPTESNEYLNTDDAEKTLLKKLANSSAVLHYKKTKANWDTEDSYSEEGSHPCSPFRYTVSASRSATSHTRHPSLGPVQESFTSPPSSSAPFKPRKSCSPGASLSAVVIRRKPKPQQKSPTDSPKEPTVSPLVLKVGSDPACTGGSVVKSPSGGQIFTGVLLEQKQGKADWSCSFSEEEVLENVGREIKTAQRKYCKQLLTAFYMDAGDFSATVEDFSDHHEGAVKTGAEVRQEEAVISVDDQIVESGRAACAAEMTAGDAGTSADVQCNKVRNVAGRPKKRESLSSESCDSHHPAKRAKSLQDEGSSQSPYQSMDSDDTSSDPVPSRINGIDTKKLPADSSQTASYSDFVPPDDRRESAAEVSPFSFPSPTRRSGRTPIPSKKILDALEDAPLRSLLKVRRVSSVSSDDAQSGYSSEDISLKKLSAAPPTSPS